MWKDPYTEQSASVEVDGVNIEIAPNVWRTVTWRELETIMRALKSVTSESGDMLGTPGKPVFEFSRCAKEHWGETGLMFMQMRHESQVKR